MRNYIEKKVCVVRVFLNDCNQLWWIDRALTAGRLMYVCTKRAKRIQGNVDRKDYIAVIRCLTITYWRSVRKLGVYVSSAGFHSWWQYSKFILVVWQNLGQWVKSVYLWKISKSYLYDGYSTLNGRVGYWRSLFTPLSLSLYPLSTFQFYIVYQIIVLLRKSTNCSLLKAVFFF